MAKKAVKKETPAELKVVKKVTTRSKSDPSSPDVIEKACEAALTKLKSLNIAPELQADLQWCLGSYRNDKNPSGLYEMGGKALAILKDAVAKNAKAVSKKLLTDLDKALNTH